MKNKDFLVLTRFTVGDDESANLRFTNTYASDIYANVGCSGLFIKKQVSNVIKVIGYTPILIELCIPYFFTILQKFFAVELFPHNLICINELERRRLVHVIVQPV